MFVEKKPEIFFQIDDFVLSTPEDSLQLALADCCGISFPFYFLDPVYFILTIYNTVILQSITLTFAAAILAVQIVL